MKTIKALEDKLSILRQELAVCTDPEQRGDIDEKIDFIQDEIDEMEGDVDPEDIYDTLGHDDSPSLDMSLHY